MEHNNNNNDDIHVIESQPESYELIQSSTCSVVKLTEKFL